MATPRHHDPLLVLIVVLLAGGMFLPWLGRLPLRYEEPTHALTARTMMTGGSYLVPVVEGRVYTAKPPLFSWLVVAASRPGGAVTETSARLPSVVSLIVLAVFLVLATGGVLGLEGRAFLGIATVLMHASVVKATLAELDVTFTLFVTLSLWGWFRLDRRRPGTLAPWVVSGLFAGLAFLTKREPGLVFYYLAIGGHLLWTRRLGELRSGRALLGLGLPLAIAALWPVALALEAGPAALWESFRVQILTRGLPVSSGDLLRHLLVYPFGVLGAMLPFSLLLLPLALPAVRRRVRERYGDAFTFAVCAWAANFPVYWLRGDVAVRYVMPLYPLALLVAAMVFEQWTAGAVTLPGRVDTALRALPRSVAWALLPAGGLLALMGVLGRGPLGLPTLVPWPVAVGLGVAVIVSGGVLRAHAAAEPGRSLLAALAAVVVVSQLFYFTTALPRRIERVERDENARGIVAAIEQLRGAQAQVDVVGTVPRAVWFYADPHLLRPLPRPRRQPPAAGRLFLFDERSARALVARALPAWETVGRFPFKQTHLVLGRVIAGAGGASRSASCRRRDRLLVCWAVQESRCTFTSPMCSCSSCWPRCCAGSCWGSGSCSVPRTRIPAKSAPTSVASRRAAMPGSTSTSAST